MQSAAIVIVSLFAGAFLIVVVAGMAALIVLHIRQARAHKMLLDQFAQFTDVLDGTLNHFHESQAESWASSVAELRSLVDGARTSFTGLRQDIKAAQDAQTKALEKTLKAHETAFRDTMGRINAAAMEAAAVKGIHAANRMVEIANMLQRLLSATEVPEPAAIGPEDYAPSDTIYSLQSHAARMDRAEMQTEVEENAPQYSGAAAE